jgi:hypothetical protein
MSLVNAHDIVALRRELAHAERVLRERAEREARRLGESERIAWREARDSCWAFDRIREAANAGLETNLARGRERFPGECSLAEMALRDADRADVAYTVISFARLTDRLRYLRGGADREAVIRETFERGGVYTDAYRGRHFHGIVR